jgi:hypothetical protein
MLLGALVTPAAAQPVADSVPQAHETQGAIAQTTPPGADYAWPDSAKPGASIRLEARFVPPEGFERVPAPHGGFAAWLRNLPLRTDRTHVLDFKGRPLVRPSAAVSTLDVSPRDVQQCADSVLRLHAEYLWTTGRAAKAAYHFTSGDRSAWLDWQKGERFRVQGSKVARVRQGAGRNDHANFRDWLDHLFLYAGTRSLALDSDPVGGRAYEAGDFFVTPGSPGHAVLLLDVVQTAAGQRAALVGQGFMPAEDFHVLWSAGPRVLAKVWFLLPDETDPELDTPSWAPFGRADGRRLRSPR